MTSLCSHCHHAPAKSGQAYCVECYRVYQRDWARRHRGSKPRPVKPVCAPGEKFCTKCRRVLPIERFSRCRSKSDGLMSNCKECDYFKQLAYKERHRRRLRPKFREASRQFRAVNPGYNARACARYKRRRIEKKMRVA